MKLETKENIKKEFGNFSKRLLSTKLVTLVVFWTAGNIWLVKKYLTGEQWVMLTMGLATLIIGGSYLDKKADNDKQLFNGEK